jgi:hypothetical protein
MGIACQPNALRLDRMRSESRFAVGESAGDRPGRVDGDAKSSLALAMAKEFAECPQSHRTGHANKPFRIQNGEDLGFAQVLMENTMSARTTEATTDE